MAEQHSAAAQSPPDSILDASAKNGDESTDVHQPFFSSCRPIRSVSYSNSWEGVCAPPATDPVSQETKSLSPRLTDNEENNLVQDRMEPAQSKAGFDVPDEESNQQPGPLSTDHPGLNRNDWDLWPVDTNKQLLPFDSSQANCNISTAPCDMEAKQFSLSFSNRRQPKYVGAGLSNMGNTCFINATLQCITHTVPLVLKIHSTDHSTPCSFDKDGFCSFCALKEHVDESIQRSGSIIMPVKFRDNLRNLCSYFRPGQQEDAHEFLRCLLDNLDKCTVDPGSKGKASTFDEESMVKQVFGGQLKSQLSCCECGHSSETFEPFLDLRLEINQVDNLVDALKSFTKVEQIGDSEEKLTCEHCKAKVCKNKQLTLDKAPDVLAFQLKRFTNIDNSIEKIDKHVAYPSELDLKPFSNPDAVGELKYDLYGVVEHSGLLPNYGHYVCTIRSSPITWYLMNDSHVESISDASALNQEAYILFYVRQGKFPWFSSLLNGKDAKSDDSSYGASPVSVLENIDPNCSTSTGEGTSSSDDDNLMKNENWNCQELEKDKPSQCRSSLIPGKSPKESLLGASKSFKELQREISPHRVSLQDDTPVRYPCAMESTNLDRPSTPHSKRLSHDNDFSVFEYEDLDDEDTPLMPELKFKPNSKKTKAASASRVTKGSCVDQNTIHLMRGMTSSRRKGFLECMPTHHNAKQKSRRCPATDPLDKKKRKLVQC